ncbi:MAG: hypothetical protein ACEY3L_17830, partial [Wolbachia sp.]
QSSLWLFEACSCKPAPRGPPSSTAQLQHFPCFYGALSSQCLYDVMKVADTGIQQIKLSAHLQLCLVLLPLHLF